MSLSTIALLCLESNSYFKQDILFMRERLDEDNGDDDENRLIFRDLYKEYRKYPKDFYEYTRMSVKTFDYILEHIEAHLQQHINSKRVITNAEKLFITLRYIAHGISFNILSHTYRLGRSTIAKTVYQTLKAIWKAFSDLYIPTPTRKHFKKISEDYFLKWQFPNCIGAIDENYYKITKPAHRKCSSLVLQAVSDADYKFVAIEIKKASESEFGTFQFSTLNDLLTNNKFNVPPPQKPPEWNVTLPHVLVANETYPLKTYLMRPFPRCNLDRDKNIFNQRLSRARATIDRAFGIFSLKWQIFSKSISTNTKHATLIIKVACVLHNIIRQRDGSRDKDFRKFMNNFSESNIDVATLSKRNNRSTFRATGVRNQFKNYFVNNPI